jgi:putative cofactor-binding repeat protein
MWHKEFPKIGGTPMKKKFLWKCFIALGLFLFFTLLIPFTSYNVATAQASTIEKEKNVEYRLNLKSITLIKGKSFTLKVYNLGESAKVSFKSDDQEVASVNDDGLISANKVGTTVVTAIVKDGSNTTNLICDVTVGPPAFSIKLTRSKIILGLENSDQLRVILKPSNTAEVARFSSFDSSIASVSTGGRISAKSTGMTYLFAEIDATNLDGTRKFAVCSVIVTSQEDAPLLETYFSDHPELNDISEADLMKALDDFFNGKTNGTSSKVEDVSKSTMVNNLNRYLENKFNLAALRTARQTEQAKTSLNQLEVTTDNAKK